MLENIVSRIHKEVAAKEEEILQFFREIVAIPSMESDIEEVGKRIGEEMVRLGFDEVYVDRYGSIVGRMGEGEKIILFDSHIDTVGIGDPDQWDWDPFEGKIEDGKLYARGALDEKGSTPGMVYGIALAKELGLLEGFTAYYLGNIEEWCDGIGCQAFVEWEGITPDFVVIGEPTKMQVYRGHKGRLELEVDVTGKSAHAASNQFGDNAIYKMMPVINGIKEMNDVLPSDPFLGQGRITVTRIGSVSPSDNAVPDQCTIFIDRRITFGETKEGIIESIKALIPEEDADSFEVRELVYTEPSHTGAVFAYEKYFPAWAIGDDHELVEAGQRAVERLFGERRVSGKWDFSTNGNYWTGKLGVPSIGFGPGDEIYAHAVNEHVPLSEVVDATKFYALLPYLLRQGSES